MRELFGTTEIARICCVSTRTAAKFIDSGLLQGWRVPGSKTRRTSRKLLVQFLAEHGMPAIDEPQSVAESAAADSDSIAAESRSRNDRATEAAAEAA